MSFRVRRILVALRNDLRAPRGALRKAAALARANGARIELFHAINEPTALDALRRGWMKGEPGRKVIATVAERAEKHLARLASHGDLAGLKVTCHASWDFPPHEAIIRRATATDADLILASVQPKSVGGRLLLANTDWELIRHSPCPVLLIKSSRPWRKPAVIAAIDPFHAHEKPAALDRRILEAGGCFARELGGALHAFHAYMPLTAIAPMVASQPMAVALPPELEDVHATQVKNTFDSVVKRSGIPEKRRHLEMGITQDELNRVVREIGAGLVVTGAVSRSGWRRFLIGSTAERILDSLECDLLIIKPRDFRTRVPRRTTLAWLEG
jgi:universal stress protein E